MNTRADEQNIVRRSSEKLIKVGFSEERK